ncbi:MAG: hypothetical protein ABI266_07845, partial [Ginsengibacter sp.]
MKKYFFSYMVTLLLCMTNTTFAQTARYVKPTSSGDGSGSSWNNASPDLQSMINASSADDEVWVSGGTYLPTHPADNLNTIDINNQKNAFVLKMDVKIYGGFAGTET